MKYESIVKFRGTQGNFRSCFAFSIHKCGSTMMNRMLKDIFTEHDIPWVDIPAPLYSNGIGPEWYQDKEVLKLIKPGFVYLGYRTLPQVFIENINFSKTLNVLLVRDPRDALVSQYFSFKPDGSHSLPRVKTEVFYERLKKAADGLTIDEYVLKMSSTTKNRFMAYKPLLDDGSINLYRYEDAFFDKAGFLRNILRDMNFVIPNNTIEDVARKHDIRPEVENPYDHIRKGYPGDYKEKLERNTILSLDSTLKPVLELYGYPAHEKGGKG